MDKLTELYARSAYEGRAPLSAVDDLRSLAATGVLVAGVCLNILAPFVLGWWLLDVVGLR